MISRTGYTGERGYELFVRGQDAPMIWDRILEEGAAMGIIPCRFTTLDMLRAESYLLFFPFDNSEMYPFEDEGPGDTLWELGLDFTVSPGKTGFRGAEEHYRLKGKERFKIWGLKLEGKNVPALAHRVPRWQEGRCGHPADVFAAERLEHRHRPPAGRLRQQRHRSSRCAAAPTARLRRPPIRCRSMT
jgi:glycine cleavage system aminomethyltransferase T